MSSPRVAQPPIKTRKTVEKDLSTFVATEKGSGSRTEAQQPFPQYVFPKRYIPTDLAQARIHYDEIMKKRDGPKIVDVSLRLNPGTEGTFWIKLKRQNGDQTIIDKARVLDFGYWEWIEIAECLSKRMPTKDEHIWLLKMKSRCEMKLDVEEALKIKSDPLPDCIQSITHKRKSSEGSSSERISKKR